MSQYVSVRTIASRLRSQFKVDMDTFDVVQACTDALKEMGLIALERSVMIANVSNFCVNLPTGVWKVRGVIRLDGVPDSLDSITVQDIYFPPQVVFVMEEKTLDTEPIVLKSNYVPQFKGPYIDFVWDCPVLKFNETDVPVAIETTSLKTDKEGFPMIPEPAFIGCLYYALYLYYQPLFLLGQISPQVFNTIEEWKERNVAKANQGTLMEALTANERDNMMNILTSMDRKSFNIPS